MPATASSADFATLGSRRENAVVGIYSDLRFAAG